MRIQVLRPGPLALVEDAGRYGLAGVGVSPSGAFDRRAFAAGAALVGNDPAGQAAIEIVLGGLAVRALGRVTVALTGAAGRLEVAGRPVPFATSFELAPGQELTLGMAGAGLRSYLSVAGGIEVPPVLGSRSTDLLSGLGPPRLVAGTVLPVGTPAHEPAPIPWPDEAPAGATVLTLLPGPRTDWLADPESLARAWTVSPDSNRVGVRLTGPALARASRFGATELPSEPLVRGAVQLPPSGQPVIFGPDHPTSGGYPVVAVLTEASSDRLAQCRPGESVYLAWATSER
ncbi:MAG: biotin-dependent carboxyltransferase family protein [Propionibacteriaceae bacterium]|nr:biotin-dependent carboxyltransferase family protein [Propionibacteriaceae bacterium]